MNRTIFILSALLLSQAHGVESEHHADKSQDHVNEGVKQNTLKDIENSSSMNDSPPTEVALTAKVQAEQMVPVEKRPRTRASQGEHIISVQQNPILVESDKQNPDPDLETAKYEDLSPEVKQLVDKRVHQRVEYILQKSASQGKTDAQRKLIYNTLKKIALGLPVAVVAYQLYENDEVPPYVIEAIKTGGWSLWQLALQLISMGAQWGGKLGSSIGQSFVTPETSFLIKNSLGPVGGALGTIGGGL